LIGMDIRLAGMRRTHLRKHDNILKRLLIHVVGANLGSLLRNRYGSGTPRSLQGLSVAVRFLLHWSHARAIPKNTSYSPREVTRGRIVPPYYRSDLCSHFSHSESHKLTSPRAARLG
jgi:hypothetical protein